MAKVLRGDCAIRLRWFNPRDVPSRVDQDRLHIICVGVKVSFKELPLFDPDDLGQTFPHKVIC